MAQMHLMMKEKGIDASINYSNLSSSEEDDPLPCKFIFPNMKKFTDINVTTQTQGYMTGTKGMGRHKVTNSQSKPQKFKTI